MACLLRYPPQIRHTNAAALALHRCSSVSAHVLLWWGFLGCSSRLPPLHTRARSHAERDSGNQLVLFARAVEVDVDLIFVDREMFRDDLDNAVAQLLDGPLGQTTTVIRQRQFQTLLRSLFTGLLIVPRREMFHEFI